jgi:hypothetical protein
MKVADDVNLDKVDDSRVARAKPQPNFGISRAKTQRRKGKKKKIPNLATWREEYPDPRVFGA